MKNGLETDILRQVTDHYLKSGDFNGTSVPDLVKSCALEPDTLCPILIHLIQDDKISIVFPDRFPNPFIRAFPDEDEATQIYKLTTIGIEQSCAYPSSLHLKMVVHPEQYEGRPFTLRLALGEPQLSHLSFDLAVLESYRNNPLYYYTCDGVYGNIGVKSGSAERLRTTDTVLIQSFGFSYDENWNRAVAVFLRYLAKLTPEHQQIWNARLLDGKYNLHPEYYKTHVLGLPPEGISVFTAFEQEQHCINEMCKLMDRHPLFKHEFTGAEDRLEHPRHFGVLVRPTLDEYNSFIHLLDKMLSENINRKFFHDLCLEDEQTRSDGKVVVREKGTIQLLQEWIELNYHFDDATPVNQMIGMFREIRKERQHPAHAVQDDKFDESYAKKQREIMERAYEGIRTLRLIFNCHPLAKDYSVPAWVGELKIWTL